MTPTKINLCGKAQTGNLPTYLWPMPPEQFAIAMEHILFSFPRELLRQHIQPTPAMWPNRIEHQVQTHQGKNTILNLSLISIEDVLVNSRTSLKIFTGWLTELLGQLGDLLFERSSLHLMHLRNFVKGITMAFSCGARSAFKLGGKDYLRDMLSRRQLQGFVGQRPQQRP
jgi:hypothetical protein